MKKESFLWSHLVGTTLALVLAAGSSHVAATPAAALLAASVPQGQARANTWLAPDQYHGDHCGVDDEIRPASDALGQAFVERDLRPMPYPARGGGGSGVVQTQSEQNEWSHPVGLIPADYINPVDLAREQGHLRQEVDVHVEAVPDAHRLVQVLSFDAPDWARMMLVEFRHPDGPEDERGIGGIHLRPHNPFVEGQFPAQRGWQWFMNFPDHPDHERLVQGHNPELDYFVIRQEAYRSSAATVAPIDHFPGNLTVMADQYILVTRDMDPAPAGKSWHVAISSSPTVFNPNGISGTLRVYFSSQTYRPPLAIQLYYDAAEEQEQVGFFDPTPRVPDGDNPGTTVGEAWRWALFKSTELLLDELGYDGFLPIRVLARTDDNLGFNGTASSLYHESWAPPRAVLVPDTSPMVSGGG